MNDYKELIALLNGAMMITASNGKIEKANLFCKAADAIEQLVKERDAAIVDLSGLVNNCFCCVYYNAAGLPCKSKKPCCIDGNPDRWEWRGVQEDNDEKERNL